MKLNWGSFAFAMAVAHFSSVCAAAKIVIDQKTPSITPTEFIYAFPSVDWEKIEARQDAGKANVDNVVMQCDDTYLTLVEIKLPDGLEDGVTVEADDCKLRGASYEQDFPAWLQFEGPDSSTCTIKIQKARAGGKAPLVMEYELSDAC